MGDQTMTGHLRIIFRGGATIDVQNAEIVVTRRGSFGRDISLRIVSPQPDELDILDPKEVIAIQKLPDDLPA